MLLRTNLCASCYVTHQVSLNLLQLKDILLCKYFLSLDPIFVVSPVDVVNVNAKFTPLCSGVHVVNSHLLPLRVCLQPGTGFTRSSLTSSSPTLLSYKPFFLMRSPLSNIISCNFHHQSRKHHTKLFIRGEPIRFWFKLLCVTSFEGYFFHAEPYLGVDTDLPDTGLGQAAGVVLGLIGNCEVKAGSTITFDNLFTSFPLLDELTKLGIGALSTFKTVSMVPSS